MSWIPKATQSTTYIKNTVKEKGADVLQETISAGKYYTKNVKDRWSAGARLAEKHNMGKVCKVSTQLKSVATGLRFKQKHLPALLGFLTLTAPVPAGGPFTGYAVGKVINRIINVFKKVK